MSFDLRRLVARGVGGISRRIAGVEFDDLLALGCGVTQEMDPATAAVALTFDDGPSVYATARILDILDAHNAQATFFVLGANVRQHPDLLREIARRGHGIGIHGDAHLDYHWTSPWRIERDVREAKRVTEDVIGGSVDLLRAPYGHFRWDVAAIARRAGLGRLIGWSVAPAWDETSPHALSAYVESRVRSGSIVLLHDATGLEPADVDGRCAAVVAALPRVIASCRERGLGLERLA